MKKIVQRHQPVQLVQNGTLGIYVFFFFFKFLFIYDSHRERERERGRDIGRGRSRGRSRLHAPGADVGFDPWSPGSRPGPKAGAKPLRHPGIPPMNFSNTAPPNFLLSSIKGCSLLLFYHHSSQLQ